ncbi:hypothetical protein [Paraburkholderia tropica]|uniref:hypothetical protein n=1 Tax=Paraburkholderia tropica TaxID=92647 RepID=UPI003D271EC7
MDDLNYSRVAEEGKPDGKTRPIDLAKLSTNGMGSADLARVLSFLWGRSQNGLTPNELYWIAGAAEAASSMATDLKSVMDGIGCLVMGDTREGNRLMSGNFQSNSDVPSLLFTLSNQVGAIAELAQIGSDAFAMLVHSGARHA